MATRNQRLVDRDDHLDVRLPRRADKLGLARFEHKPLLRLGTNGRAKAP
jgi:hypothetical protein